MRYTIHFSIKARIKLKTIYNYIENFLYNPQAAERFITDIILKTSILYYFPQAGPKYKNTQYRYLIMKHWLILYKPKGNYIKIYDIISSKQNSKQINLN